jgi:hypothetical protein
MKGEKGEGRGKSVGKGGELQGGSGEGKKKR